MQTLHIGCSKAEPKIFAPDPLPGGAGRPKFNQLEMVTKFTYKPSLVRIDACNFKGLSWIVVTDPQTHTQTDRGQLQYTARRVWLASAQCKYEVMVTGLLSFSFYCACCT